MDECATLGMHQVLIRPQKTIGKELSEKKFGGPAKWFLDIPEEAWLTFMNALEEIWRSMREVDDFLVDMDILHSNAS